MSVFSKLIVLSLTVTAFSALNAVAGIATDAPACEPKCSQWSQYISHAPLGCFEARSCVSQEMRTNAEGVSYCGNPAEGEPVTAYETRIVRLGALGVVHCMPEAY